MAETAVSGARYLLVSARNRTRAEQITPAERARRARAHAADLIAEAAARRVRDRFRGPDTAALDTLSLRLLAGEIDADEAAREALDALRGKQGEAASS